MRITLVQGVSRGERMDWVIQKATELGVTSVVPVLTERSVVKLDSAQRAKKARHWHAIAIAACEQCGRNRVPAISEPRPYEEWLGSRVACGTELLLNPAAEYRLTQIAACTAATVLIGPEGGLSQPERLQARDAGFTPVQIGPRVLRTETAAIAAVALLQARFGDL